jgi:exonuclease SbcD
MRILHFSDLHLGVESYGHIDPQTGLPSRMLDFLKSLDEVVDYALGSNIDLVLFSGDAYKSRDPSQTQQREFARRIARLASSNIPVFLLVGNHDIPNAFGRATAVEIFDTLAIKNVHVASLPGIHRIETPSGSIQVAALPWLRRGAFLSREEFKNLGLQEMEERMGQVLTDQVASQVGSLDPDVPSVLAAHVWVHGARLSSERRMVVGREPILQLSALSHPRVGYVALGHMHRHQVLSLRPPIVYAGSLERIDFSEEEDEKGFVVVEMGGGETSFDFHPVQARGFCTISVKIDAEDLNPTATVMTAIARSEHRIRDAIVRVEVDLPAHGEGMIQERDIRQTLERDYGAYYVVPPALRVEREHRMRLGAVAAETMTPLEALKAYLDTKKVSPGRARTLLEYGERIIGEGEG